MAGSDGMNAWSPDPQTLRDRIAVVAGATRGAGRGIAAALGEAGATVICTGRSTRAEGPTHSDYDRPETIEETAELVTRLGGTGVVEVIVDLLLVTAGSMRSPGQFGSRVTLRWRPLDAAPSTGPPPTRGDPGIPPAGAPTH